MFAARPVIVHIWLQSVFFIKYERPDVINRLNSSSRHRVAYWNGVERFVRCTWMFVRIKLEGRRQVSVFLPLMFIYRWLTRPWLESAFLQYAFRIQCSIGNMQDSIQFVCALVVWMMFGLDVAFAASANHHWNWNRWHPLQPNKLKHKKLTWTRPAASKRQHCIIGRKIKFPCTGREFCNISRVMFAVSSDAHFYLHFYNRLYDFKFEIEWWRRPKWGRMRKMCKRQHIETETKKTQYFNAHERHTLGNTQCFQHRRSFSDATILYPRKKNAWKNWVEMIK